MHSVQQLYQYRKSVSTKPFNARGKKVVRCQLCQVAKENCMCNIAKSLASNSAFLILMHDAEVLKPSNTARLIADLIPETYAFLWSRTNPESQLLNVLQDPQYLPLVVFPKAYAQPERVVYNNELPTDALSDKKPLFILLDGSWREAKKMFRKSPYLNKFSIASFEEDSADQSREYYIRESVVENQLATAQVASRMLSLYGESENASRLSMWFDVFNYQYQKSVCQINQGREDAMANFLKAQN